MHRCLPTYTFLLCGRLLAEILQRSLSIIEHAQSFRSLILKNPYIIDVHRYFFATISHHDHRSPNQVNFNDSHSVYTENRGHTNFCYRLQVRIYIFAS